MGYISALLEQTKKTSDHVILHFHRHAHTKLSLYPHFNFGFIIFISSLFRKIHIFISVKISQTD